MRGIPFSGEVGDADFSVLLLVLPSFSSTSGDVPFCALLCDEVIVVMIIAFGRYGLQTRERGKEETPVFTWSRLR